MAGKETNISRFPVHVMADKPSSPLERIFPSNSEGNAVIQEARRMHVDYLLGLVEEGVYEQFIDDSDNRGVLGVHDRRLGDQSVMGNIRLETKGFTRPQLLAARNNLLKAEEPIILERREPARREPRDTAHGRRYNPLSGEFSPTRHALGSDIVVFPSLEPEERTS